MKFSKDLKVSTCDIPGVLIFDIPVHGDNRGWFKENWQREKMLSLGLPDFQPVQNNISFNETKGTTRGIHAEPWDKFISVATGSVFGAWVDLREGDTFGKVFTTTIDPSKAIFIPRGIGNSFQTLEDGTAYTYLVNDHWSSEAQSQYTFLNLADETVNINWPIDLAKSELSEKDKNHPKLKDVIPMQPKKTLVLGANGQLAKALKKRLPDAEFVTRREIDITKKTDIEKVNWNQYETVINAAAYTNVDLAETEGRQECWDSNAIGVGYLANSVNSARATLVHISSDYVFDGTKKIHTEDEVLTPIGVYGQSKAAGDIVAATAKKHYILRTSWVIGDGKNFITTMLSLAEKGIKPAVVNDQVGRLSFTDDIAAAICHLLETKANYGTYNISNEGNPQSWADIASDVFERAGYSKNQVTGISTDEYFKDKIVAPRPLQSTLDLTKIKASGFIPRTQKEALDAYFANILKSS
ncbi:MAG: bifunctional dTDP-4-dehydrorhamnose 3,5-epimerase family protein/NAD(P)-dependent oxidoreductase [Micrococcaceae bacterium]